MYFLPYFLFIIFTYNRIAKRCNYFENMLFLHSEKKRTKAQQLN